MTVSMRTSVLTQLEERRQALGMPVEALVQRSGVSRATVHRILSGDHTSASFSNVLAVAEALGLTVRLEPAADDYAFKEQEAEKKARHLVGMVQGTMGLEAQGLSPAEVDRLVRETTHKLLTGSKRKLWR